MKLADLPFPYKLLVVQFVQKFGKILDKFVLMNANYGDSQIAN